MNPITPTEKSPLKRDCPSGDKKQQGPAKKQKVEKAAKRCFVCHRKPRPIPFKCQCGGIYCNKHRLAESHDCSYDYKKDNKATLEKKMPKIVADKIRNRL